MEIQTTIESIHSHENTVLVFELLETRSLAMASPS